MARLQKEKQAAVTTGLAETTRPSLHDGLRLIRALSGDRLDCPRRLARSSAQGLASAPGGQDHTISPSAPCRSSVHEKTLRHVASIASRANVRDDRETPLVSERDGATIHAF